MNIFRHVYAIVGLGIVLAAASVASPSLGLKASPNTMPVLVTNTAANPVPVSVTGTPNVNANVSGTVTIGNPGGSPVPVRDVDTAARTPFHFLTGFQLGQFDTEATSGTVYTVPAGKRLVLETVVMSSFVMPAGERMVQLGLTGGSWVPFEVHDNGTDHEGHPRFVANFSGHLRFAAGTNIGMIASRDQGDSTVCGIEAVLDGYLEPM